MGTLSMPGAVRGLAKRVAFGLLGDYSLYAIYRLDLDTVAAPDLSGWKGAGYRFGTLNRADLAGAADPGLRSRADYTGEGTACFGIWRGAELVCAQFHWYGDRYRTRDFWPLDAGDAKSVEFYTVPHLRGRGLGPAIKAWSAWELKRMGFRRVFSRVWHSHASSRRANEKAGWRHVADVAELHPLGMRRPVRLVWRRADTA